MTYSIPASVTLSELETRVNDVYSMSTICKMPHSKILELLDERIYTPLNAKYANGRWKHTAYVRGYVDGLVASWRSRIWREYVEFCYLVDGELYSTHKTSNRKTTKEIYESGRGSILADCPSAHYWKDSEKVY